MNLLIRCSLFVLKLLVLETGGWTQERRIPAPSGIKIPEAPCAT